MKNAVFQWEDHLLTPTNKQQKKPLTADHLDFLTLEGAGRAH